MAVNWHLKTYLARSHGIYRPTDLQKLVAKKTKVLISIPNLSKLLRRKPSSVKLKTMELKLFFILYYLKVYPTYDVLGFQFGLDRSKACTNMHALWPVLERTLETLKVLPARAFSSVDELRAAFGEVQDLLIDATEREHRRPQDDNDQREKYSGKKNAIRSKIP